MKIISWNCNGALRNKHAALEKFKADLWIIPESESPHYLQNHNVLLQSNNHLWCGDRYYKGLSIFSFNDYKIRQAEFFDPRFKYILPVVVTAPDKREFLLIAVWANRVKDNPDWDYIGQLCAFMENYHQYLTPDTILLGDFNINMQWNRSFKKEHNYARFLELTAHCGFFSLYHTLTGEPQGQETTFTSYFRRDPRRGFHIDYAYLNQNLISAVRNFQIHGPEWLSLSDHTVLELEL